MTNSRFASTILSIVAIGGMVVAPSISFGFDDDHGKHHGNDHGDRGRKDDHRKDDHRRDDKHWNDHGNNGKSPKDRGLHDNRDHWWKDDHHRNDDRWRRDEERRRAEQWRRDEAWRRSHDDRYRSSNSLQAEANHRQRMKNEWRNIAYVSGGVALLGLLKHDNTLTFAGTAGALYSLYRYEQDRKSQNSLNRLRASYFSRPYFERDGHRYDRVVVTRSGQRYYQFRRH